MGSYAHAPKKRCILFQKSNHRHTPPARFLARPAGLLRHLAKFAYANRHTAVCLFAAVRTAFSQVQILGRLFQKSNHRHTAAGQIFGAPCRIRTCDLRIRNRLNRNGLFAQFSPSCTVLFLCQILYYVANM